MILGDLNHQRMSGDLRFIQDEKLLAYVADVKQKGGAAKHAAPPITLLLSFVNELDYLQHHDYAMNYCIEKQEK